MRILSFAAGVLVGVLIATSAVADPSYPLAADDPANGSGWRPPPSSTAGVQSFAPVEARDWLKPVGATTGQDGAMKGMDMKGMPGMGGGSMSGMPGMGGGK